MKLSLPSPLRGRQLRYGTREALHGYGFVGLWILGFVIFTIGVWTGSLLAGPIVGTLGEMVSWHVGFLAAGAGMAIAQGLYAVFARRLLGGVGMRPSWGVKAGPRSPSASPNGNSRNGLLLIAVFSLFTMIYSLAFFQFSGSLSLYLSTDVDRSIGAFTTSCRPSRLSPATARKVQAATPSSSFFSRVCTLPRNSTTCRCG